ncbi:hypothetical protein Cgig2_021008 [Carnegiea gigantea]|uniref:Uncharacterized protein n=1 Tax=Carnegiea gigantea TaxID=171969 RepID=A0A9Q1QEX6_9CARY|nr:hypothetical protein Cgig2_021008 [Carnegiea gigantea]
MRSKRVHDKGGYSEIESRIPRRSLEKVDKVQGKRERERGNNGKSGAEEGMVVEKEREGIGDVIVRHRCALEVVCSLNSELEEYQKSAIEGTVWSPVLKYKPFVMGRHLVRALVESWVPKLKAFRIGRREIPFSVYNVALLTGLPAIGKHVTFDQVEGPCEVEDVVKAAMDDHVSRERAREDPIEEKLVDAWVRNDTSEVYATHCKLGELVHNRKYDAAQLISTIQDNQIVPYLEVRDLERREATVKAFSDPEDFNAYVKDAQGIISIEERLQRTREALRTATEALTLERVANAAAKKELEHMRALLMGRGRGTVSREVRKIKGSSALMEMVKAACMQVTEESMSLSVTPCNLREKMRWLRPHAMEEDVVPILECDIEEPHADDVGEEGDVRMVGEGSNSSIAKRIWRSPWRRQPLAKQISPFVNPAAAPRTGKRRMGNVYTSRKRFRKVTPNTRKEEEVEEIRGGAR